MNAEELFVFLDSLEGSRDAGSRGNSVATNLLLSGVEYGRSSYADERSFRATWRQRVNGGATPLLLIADDPDGGGRLRVLGPQGDGPVSTVGAESLCDLISRTGGMGSLEAVRHLAQEVERLDTEGIAGPSPKTT